MTTKKKGDISAKLRSGLAKEDVALEERFKRADSLLLRSPEEAPPQEEAPAPASRVRRRRVSASDGETMDRVALTLPPEESARLERLKESLQKAGLYSVTRSQILRAGIEQLAKLDAEQLQQVVNAVERGQPGRKPA
ncbi:MAG: hypothetical protein JRN42_05370 [Nitrososphaerota archaeon]|nr:hypothetical protein [Nitrososphaerota archaeon]